MKTEVWAHRGASACAPENTLPAFEQAVKMGADGLETDVHLTADDELVLCHDDTLDRVSNGSGPICTRTLPELLRLDFGNGMPGFAGTRIVRLEQLLELARQTHTYLNLEMKYDSPRWELQNERTAEMVRRFGLESRVIFSSFNAGRLLALKKRTASPVALLYGGPMEAPWEMAVRQGFDALHPEFSLVGPSYAENCRRAHIGLHPWTVDRPEDLARMFRLGVGAVITNRPDEALAVRRELAREETR